MRYAVVAHDSNVDDQLIYNALSKTITSDDLLVVGSGIFPKAVMAMANALGIPVVMDKHYYNNADKTIICYGELNQFEVFDTPALQEKIP